MQKRTGITREKVDAMFAAGMTQKDVAKELGCSEFTVWQRRTYQSPTIKKKKTGKICSCCNSRRVATKPINGHILTRLCPFCFAKKSESGEEIFNVL